MARRLVDGDEIRRRIGQAGLKQVGVAQFLGIDQGKFSKTLNGTRRAKFPEMVKLAALLKAPLPEVMHLLGEDYSDPFGRLQLVSGYVGAGDEVIIEYDDGGGFDEITTPFLGYSGRVLRVRGDSMSPRYLDGEHIGYSEESDVQALLGLEVVAKTVDGRLFLKRLRKGTQPGYFTLISINPAVEPILDVQLEWASPIDWHLPNRRP